MGRGENSRKGKDGKEDNGTGLKPGRMGTERGR